MSVVRACFCVCARALLCPPPPPPLLRDLVNAPTALAACCGFDLCHKYVLYFYFTPLPRHFPRTDLGGILSRGELGCFALTEVCAPAQYACACSLGAARSTFGNRRACPLCARAPRWPGRAGRARAARYTFPVWAAHWTYAFPYGPPIAHMHSRMGRPLDICIPVWAARWTYAFPYGPLS